VNIVKSIKNFLKKIMQDQKELVDEILDLWKKKEHGLARWLLK